MPSFELGHECFDVVAQDRERLLDCTPDEGIINVFVIAVGQSIAKADDLVKIGDLLGCFGINVSQTKQRFSDDAEVALDDLSRTPVVKVGVQRDTRRVL